MAGRQQSDFSSATTTLDAFGRETTETSRGTRRTSSVYYSLAKSMTKHEAEADKRAITERVRQFKALVAS